jgi:hypothetical protein
MRQSARWFFRDDLDGQIAFRRIACWASGSEMFFDFFKAAHFRECRAFRALE